MIVLSILFSLSSTHSVNSVQSGWSPHFHPILYRENNQLDIFPLGRKQSHFSLRFFLWLFSKSVVMAIKDLLCDLLLSLLLRWWLWLCFLRCFLGFRRHKHGDSKSISLTRCFSKVVPPVFWTCKNTMTSLPLMLNSKFSCWIVS